MYRLSVEISDEDGDRMEQQAHRHRVTRSAIIREGVRMAIEQLESSTPPFGDTKEGGDND